MGCFIVIVWAGVILPRVGLFGLWLLTALGGHPWGAGVFGNILWPLLALFIAPFTTWAYMWAHVNTPGISSAELLVICIALCFDVLPWLLLRWSWASQKLP